MDFDDVFITNQEALSHMPVTVYYWPRVLMGNLGKIIHGKNGPFPNM